MVQKWFKGLKTQLSCSAKLTISRKSQINQYPIIIIVHYLLYNKLISLLDVFLFTEKLISYQVE